MSVIRQTSVSFDQTLADLTTYVQSKPGYGTYWKDFYEGAAGQTLLELIAGLAAYESFSIDSARRDTFLQEARLRSSAIAIANNLGYSAKRGSNPKFTLTVTPATTFTVAQLDILGTYKSWNILADAATTFTAGVSTDVVVTIGTSTTSSITVPSADLQPFRFVVNNVSNDMILRLNGTAVPSNSVFSDLVFDQWVTITNPQGAVDAFYANNDVTFTTGRVHNYATGDILSIYYIPLDTSINAVDPTHIKFTNGIITATTVFSNAITPESLDGIRVNGPYSSDVEHVIRSRADFAKHFSTTVPNIINTAYHDDVNLPYEHFISYIRSGLGLMTVGEKTTYLAELEKRRPLGVMPATIVDPLSVASTLSVTIILSPGYTSSTASATTDLDAILYPFIYHLGQDYTSPQVLSDMEHAMEVTYPYVKTARFSSSTTAPLRWFEYSVPAYNITII